MILKDQSDPNGRTVAVEAVAGGNSLEIRAEGYGQKNVADGHGSLAVLEINRGRLRLMVFADITTDGPTDVIDLEGAREQRREELNNAKLG